MAFHSHRAGRWTWPILKIPSRRGDACNVSGDLETLKHKFEVLRQHCETIGRDYNSIHRTSMAFCIIGETDEEAMAKFPPMMKARFGNAINHTLIGSIDTIRQRLQAYEAAGVQELLIAFPDVTQLTSIKRFASEFIV